jgi:hypothetical protein
MHITIEEALNVAEKFLAARALGSAMPAFCIDPL